MGAEGTGVRGGKSHPGASREGLPPREVIAGLLMLVALAVLAYNLRDGAPDSGWQWAAVVFVTILLVDEAVGIIRRRAARRRRRERG